VPGALGWSHRAICDQSDKVGRGSSPGVTIVLGVNPRLAKPPTSVEDETSDDHRSPENGCPNADSLANEPCDDSREQGGGIGPK
jgi:hypothetical protein